jgi:hypothetical protein
MVEILIAWLQSSTAFLVAVSAFVGAVTTLGTALALAWRKLRASRRRGSAVLRHVFSRKNPWFVAGMTLFGMAATIAIARAALPLPPSANARLATEAWDAVNDTQWAAAFAAASECVDAFGAQAEDEQHQLEQGQTALPRTGKVLPEERSAILARGVLNDAGACLFIKGQSAEKLGRVADARTAYNSAARLTYPRVYDPNGDFFWSPSAAAAARLRTMP